MKPITSGIVLIFSGLCFLNSCTDSRTAPATETIASIDLKRGPVISCSPGERTFGKVAFPMSCNKDLQPDFDLGIALLHSFEYDEAEKVFAKIIDAEPGCAMAYWGVAMANYHTLWAPPTPAELEKGAKAIGIAASLPKKSEREEAYINTVAVFYKDYDKVDHMTRGRQFEAAMAELYKKFPDDKEAAIFYALTLTGNADPTDKTYTKQKKAGEILKSVYRDQPNHPGIVHYIIHSYDSPELAAWALPEARKYASIAPASAHAQHMPSHIFTRLGLWEEGIQSNLAAANSAKCYAEESGIKGHWDEELHSLDYLVYSYLQRGDNKRAKEQLDYLNAMKEVSPVNFKVAYAFAAIPSRYVLENKMWKDAASLQSTTKIVDFQKFPWQNAIIHFTRLMGAVHTGQTAAAREELKTLNSLREALLQKKDAYSANQVHIQQKAGEAWILYKEGKNNEALRLMEEAATMEDNTQKHPVTPGEVVPMRELLADMLLAMNKNEEALKAYETNLKARPNRLNGLYGAAVTAEKLGMKEKANEYYKQLAGVTKAANSDRMEVKAALSRSN